CFKQAHIPILITGLVDQVTNPLRIECAGCRRGEDRRSVRISSSEPLAARPKCPNNFGIAVNDPKLAIASASPVSILADASVVNVRRDNAARQPGLKLRNAADLPSAQNLASKSGLTAEEWKLVKIVDNRDMAGVHIVWSPQNGCVIN